MEVRNIFNNFIAIDQIDLNKFKGSFEKKKATFESGIETTLRGDNLFTKDEINYLNLKITNMFSHLLKSHGFGSFTFEMNGLWKNFYKDLDYQAGHVHPAHFSFIIYCTGPSHTVFNHPAKNIIDSIHPSMDRPTNYEPECKKGDMIIFPSYLEHYVKPNSNNETISGNIMLIETQKVQ